MYSTHYIIILIKKENTLTFSSNKKTYIAQLNKKIIVCVSFCFFPVIRFAVTFAIFIMLY